MRLIKNKKLLKAVIALTLLLGLGFATNIIETPLSQGHTIVYADDVRVYGGESMSSGGKIFTGDIVSPDTPRGVSGSSIFTYISKDGKTRYAQVVGTEAGWYVWNPDKSNKYGGNWVRTDKNIIKQSSGGGNSAKKFEDIYGYPYTASPYELKSKFDTGEKNPSTGAPAKPAPTEETADEAEAKAEALKEYNKYIKLGDEPTSATILASAVLKGGNTTGIDRKKVSFSELSKYPYVENVDTKVDGKEVNVSVYEYGNLKNGVSTTTAGATTANVIRVLTRYGWLSTNNKSENDTSWYQELKENITNPVYAFGTIIATIGGVIADFLVTMFDSVISGLGTIVGWLLPLKIFGFSAESIRGINQVDNWFTRVIQKVIEILFGSGLKDIFYRILGLSISILISYSLFNFFLATKRDGIKSGILSFKKVLTQILILSLGVVIFVGLYPLLNTDKVEGAPARDELRSETSFDTQRFAIATNLDPSVLYPDTFGLLNSNRILSNQELDDNFKPTGKTVSEANNQVNSILGSELIAQIEEKSSSDDGVLGGVVNNKTWNVNDYLSSIETAGQPLTTSDGGFALNTAITANRLPNGLTWNNNISSVATVSVTPTQLNSDNVQDILKQGWFMFKGTPVWFDAITDDMTAKSEESSYVSSGGWVGIKYSPSIYNPQKVSQTDTHTYLYGSMQNNNAMTLNVSNYTFMSGITSNSDFLSYPKGNSPVSEGETVRRSNKPYNGEISKEISSKLAETKSEIKSDNLQWRNAYMVAMYNKYAGTNQTSQGSYATAGNMGFSNQSTMILLQSTYKKDGFSYVGYNTPNSKSDNSKAQTQDNVYMPIYSTIGSGSALSSALSRTSYGLIANAIIMYGITVSVFQFGLGIIIKDSWTYFWRWLSKGSATGLFMSVIVVIYYYTIFTISDLVSNTVLKIVSLTVTELQTDGKLGTANTFVIGFILVGIALLTTLRLINLNGRKINFVSLFFYGITIFYDNLKDFTEKIDVALYGEQYGKTDTTPNRADDAISKKMSYGYGKGAGLARSAMGSFIGNSVADRFDGSGKILPTVNSNDEQSENNSKFSLPIGKTNAENNPLVSGNSGSQLGGQLGTLGKNAVKGSLSKKLLTHGAVGALGFTPLGWAGTSYMAMRGAVKATKGIKKGYNTLKGSEFGTRIGLNGRSEQLKNHYGLKSDDELSAHISAGKIKPKSGEESHFDRFVQNNDWINSLDKNNALNPETKQRLTKMNSISRKSPTVDKMRDKLKEEKSKQRYVKNDNVKVDKSTKAIVLAKKFADGQLINHVKSNIPKRREEYLKEQFNRRNS